MLLNSVNTNLYRKTYNRDNLLLYKSCLMQYRSCSSGKCKLRWTYKSSILQWWASGRKKMEAPFIWLKDAHHYIRLWSYNYDLIYKIYCIIRLYNSIHCTCPVTSSFLHSKLKSDESPKALKCCLESSPIFQLQLKLRKMTAKQPNTNVLILPSYLIEIYLFS